MHKEEYKYQEFGLEENGDKFGIIDIYIFYFLRTWERERFLRLVWNRRIAYNNNKIYIFIYKQSAMKERKVETIMIIPISIGFLIFSRG